MFVYTYVYWLTDVLMPFKITGECTYQVSPRREEKFGHHMLKFANLEVCSITNIRHQVIGYGRYMGIVDFHKRACTCIKVSSHVYHVSMLLLSQDIWGSLMSIHGFILSTQPNSIVQYMQKLSIHLGFNQNVYMPRRNELSCRLY